MTCKVMACLCLVTALNCLTVPTAQGQVTFPASWAGHWTLTEVEKDCNTGMVLNTGQRSFSIEEGDGPEAWDPAFSFAGSTAFISDTVLSYSGSRNDIAGSCILVIQVTGEYTRDGDEVTGTKRHDVLATGCPGTSCVDYEITGTKGPSPVSPVTWGAIKALYP
jgi:hypothetical protein